MRWCGLLQVHLSTRVLPLIRSASLHLGSGQKIVPSHWSTRAGRCGHFHNSCAETVGKAYLQCLYAQF